jgi:hypothetical protein
MLMQNSIVRPGGTVCLFYFFNNKKIKKLFPKNTKFVLFFEEKAEKMTPGWLKTTKKVN